MVNRIGVFYAYWVTYRDVACQPFVDEVSNPGFDLLEVSARQSRGRAV